jgi:putative Mg2+ transporter-C (MgtC) family protein
VQGLTTGAGMWLAGAVGVACALGFYVVAIGTTVLAVIVLAALRAASHRIIGHKADEALAHGAILETENPLTRGPRGEA